MQEGSYARNQSPALRFNQNPGGTLNAKTVNLLRNAPPTAFVDDGHAR